MPAPRILVTGATGLLGGYVLAELGKRGLAAVTHALRPGCDLAGDLADPAGCAEMLATARPDVVVNLAALADVDACERDPAAAWRLNVLAPELLARGGHRLVHISTDQVYDGPGPQREDAPKPLNAYAWSKLAGEQAALRCGGGALVLRLNFLGRAGPACRRQRPGFVDWLAGSLARRERITLVTDVVFNPLSGRTAAARIVDAACSAVTGIFNLGARDAVSKHDAALAIAGHLGLATDCASAGRLGELAVAARRPTCMHMAVGSFEASFACRLPAIADELAAACLPP